VTTHPSPRNRILAFYPSPRKFSTHYTNSFSSAPRNPHFAHVPTSRYRLETYEGLGLEMYRGSQSRLGWGGSRLGLGTWRLGLVSSHKVSGASLRYSHGEQVNCGKISDLMMHWQTKIR